MLAKVILFLTSTGLSNLHRLDNRNLISRRIKIRVIKIQLVNARHFHWQEAERRCQSPTRLLPRQISPIEDEVACDCIRWGIMAILSEADRQNFIFDGSDVEKGSCIEVGDGSGSRIKLGVLNCDY